MLAKSVSFLACPECKGDLTLERAVRSADGERVESGELRCASCSVAYPIVDAIPRFAKGLESVKEKTAESFGFKWEKFSKIDPSYKQNFLDELDPVDYRTFFEGKTVLDAGTGIGIPALCMAESGAEAVYGADISTAIRAAYENTKHMPQVTISQADIYKLPFRKASFDVVVCVAVLQHLPEPTKAFAELLTYVKPGGTILIWVYGKEGNAFVQYAVEPLRKHVTTRMPLPVLLGCSYALGAAFEATARLVYKPLARVGVRGLPLQDYIVYRAQFDFKMNTHMIFDQLLAPLSYLFTREEVEAMLKTPEIETYQLRHHNKNSWTAVGRKRVDATQKTRARGDHDSPS